MNKGKTIVWVQIILNLMLIAVMVIFPSNLEVLYKENYFVDVICFSVVIALYSYYILKVRADILDPITIITVIYSMLYFLTPIYDIVTGNHYWFGYNLFPYGIKSSVIALAGYVSFYLFYVFGITNKRSDEIEEKAGSTFDRTERTDSTFSTAILIFYFFAVVANLFYLLRSGYGNILYILTMGLMGSGNSNITQQASIGFISMFSYCLPTLVLLYWEYGKNKILTFVMFMLMFMLQVTRGFRFLVVQIIVSFAAYYYISRKKRPKVRQLILWAVVLMIPVLLMTIFRDAVRSGTGIGITAISFTALKDAVEDAITDNFRIYNNFYGVVHMVPARFEFVYFRQIVIGTIVMMIPRIIWPGKISSQAGVDLDQIVGIRLKNTGQAYPGLGEYYYAFGIIGVIGFMAIYGIWMRSVKDRYMDSSDPLDTIVFSVLMASNLQLLIRGYTPSNVWYLIFSLLPVLMIRIIMRFLYRSKGDVQTADIEK